LKKGDRNELVSILNNYINIVSFFWCVVMVNKIKQWFDDIGVQGQIFFLLCIQTFIFVIIVNLKILGIW